MSRQIHWQMEPILSEPSKSQMDQWNSQILSALIHTIVEDSSMKPEQDAP